VPDLDIIHIQLNLKRFKPMLRHYGASDFPRSGRRQSKRGNPVSAFRKELELRPGHLLVALSMVATLLPVPVAAEAGARQQIETAVSAHVGALIAETAHKEGWREVRHNLTMTPLSNPDGLPRCSTPLEIVQTSARPSPLDRLRLDVRCPDTPGWSLTVSTQQNIALAVQTVATSVDRGQTIEARHLTEETINVSRAQRGFLTSADQAIGMVTKRRLRAGQVLTPNLLDAPLPVRKGQQIRLVAQDQGVAATTLGEALADGHVGETIKVRNLASNKVVDARIVEPGIASTLIQP